MYMGIMVTDMLNDVNMHTESLHGYSIRMPKSTQVFRLQHVNRDNRPDSVPNFGLTKNGFAGRDWSKARNELANRAFLTEKPSKKAGSLVPTEYLSDVRDSQPGALQAQSVPLERELWNSKNYRLFLQARRRLLANAMNKFIASWVDGEPPPIETSVRQLMEADESDSLEFKSNLRWDHKGVLPLVRWASGHAGRLSG